MKFLPWGYFAALAGGILYLWRAKYAPADPDSEKLRELRRLDLLREDPQEVTFTLILWSESSSRRLAGELERLGFKTAVERHSADGDWICLAVREICVTLETLRECRRHFEGFMRTEGGAYEGWELSSDEPDAAA